MENMKPMYEILTVQSSLNSTPSIFRPLAERDAEKEEKKRKRKEREMRVKERKDRKRVRTKKNQKK